MKPTHPPEFERVSTKELKAGDLLSRGRLVLDVKPADHQWYTSQGLLCVTLLQDGKLQDAHFSADFNLSRLRKDGT